MNFWSKVVVSVKSTLMNNILENVRKNLKTYILQEVLLRVTVDSYYYATLQFTMDGLICISRLSSQVSFLARKIDDFCLVFLYYPTNYGNKYIIDTL